MLIFATKKIKTYASSVGVF